MNTYVCRCQLAGVMVIYALVLFSQSQEMEKEVNFRRRREVGV